MPHRNPICFSRIQLGLDASSNTGARRSGRYGQTAGVAPWLFANRIQLQGQDIWDRSLNSLFGEGEIIAWQYSLVEDITNCADPALVKGVKKSRVNARPVVNWHGNPSVQATADDSPPLYRLGGYFFDAAFAAAFFASSNSLCHFWASSFLPVASYS